MTQGSAQLSEANVLPDLFGQQTSPTVGLKQWILLSLDAQVV